MDDHPFYTLVNRDNDYGCHSHKIAQRVEESPIQSEVGVEEWRSDWSGAVEVSCPPMLVAS
jgi:hypothetical protein